MIKDYFCIYDNIIKLKSKYIDEEKKLKLQNMGIYTILDVLYHFPRTYENRTNFLQICNIGFEQYGVIRGKIQNVLSVPIRSRFRMIKSQISDDTGIMEIVWFQMPYLKNILKVGDEYIFIGQIKKSNNNWQMINPEFKGIHDNNKDWKGEILPIYNATKDLTQKTQRKIVKEVIDSYLPILVENIPDDILTKYNLIGRKKAILAIHLPQNEKEIEEAQRRFKLEELLLLEMGILQPKYDMLFHNTNNYKLENKKELVRNYIDKLGFVLTNAQKKVITDIYKELNSGKMVNRLLQGDVGSGKTAVAMILLLYMVDNGYQGALMAPTEILAEQHFLSIKKIFAKLDVMVELLTGSVKDKKKVLDKIKTGKIDIVIGTHALIEENVKFKNLGLIIIDEQHRFGVVQRQKLKEKGMLSNIIVMSATPIPRSLALSIYGDLDVSIIDELPLNRKKIITKWIKTIEEKKEMYNFISKKINEGQQIYFVAPLIDKSEKLILQSTDELHKEVKKMLPSSKIGILHGRLKSEEKDKIMTDFKNKKLDIIVATTVIEVGINVPNATIIVIESAERFGLSSLHQLRGRVGRGKLQSYCFLVSNGETLEAQERLKIMESTTDGFKIAEEDLKLRKFGEIFGTKQSGVGDLKFPDIIFDVKTITIAKKICEEYLVKNKGEIENPYLKIDVIKKIRKNLKE